MNRRMILLMVLALLCCRRLDAQKLQLSTNTVGWMSLGTANLQFDYAVERRWTVGLNVKYNPFTFKRDSGASQMQLRQRSVAAFARWWPWHVYSGWWVTGKLQWQEYNMGGLISPRTEEGNRFGAGITAGYSFMLGEHWNVELGMGLWGGMKKYTVYACPTCGLRLDEGSKTFVMPNDLIVSFGYVF